MPDPLRPSSGNGISRKHSSPSLNVPGPRTGGDRTVRRIRSHSNLGNLAAAAVAAQAPSDQPAPAALTTPPSHQAAPILHAQPPPLSAAAIFQGKVEVWMAALSHQGRVKEQEAEQADLAAATANLQALSISAGSPSAGFAPAGSTSTGQTSSVAPLQPSPRLPTGCDECYDGGVMPCAECEEAMNLAASGCRCEPGGITSCDHPNCKAAEYDQEDQDEEMEDGDASAFDKEDEDDYEFGYDA
ncbi:hypothetical protein FPQ18DRAFT_410561 [Pyronema domesticum]|nr:hypothetical protein FPQ18DRAFT_410561 [Pyronema domesticum]